MRALSRPPVEPLLELEVPCDLDEVRPHCQRIREFLASENCTEEEIMGFELACVEALNNAVLYVDDRGRAMPIDVRLTAGEFEIECRIFDHTPGFEMPVEKALPDADSESGRGLFIMQSLMDDLSYARGRGGNCLVMRKRRANARPEANPLAVELEAANRMIAENEQVINDMAEELSSCYESLSAIFRCGAELGKTENIRDFSQCLCQDLLKITEGDWFVLRVAPKDELKLAVFCPLSTGLEPLDLTVPEADLRSAEARSVLRRQDCWFMPERPLPADDPLQKFQPCVMCMVHPLYYGQTMIGTIAVGKSKDETCFTAAQANVVHTFADFLAIQIVNARLRDEHMASRLVSHELNIARNIQKALLPKRLPKLAGFNLAGYCESARQVGGDFYDAVTVDEHSALLVIADVMGKGVPAAMFASILRSLLRASPELMRHPAALLARVNRLLYAELSDVEMFITAQVVCLDLHKATALVASAGHCPLLVASRKGTEIRSIAPDGLPLGIKEDAVFAAEKIPLRREEALLLYTDGLTDARNAGNEFFGQGRLLSVFHEGIREGLNAEGLKERISSEISAYQAGAPSYDDQTFLILTRED